MDNISNNKINNKRKICSSNDSSKNIPKKICLRSDKSSDKSSDLNIKKLLLNRRKCRLERYKCEKNIKKYNEEEKQLEKQIYINCQHKWVAEERQMYEKTWYQCDICGLYKNPYIYR